MEARPRNTFGGWLRRYSLTLVAALGGAAGVAYAVGGRAAEATPNTSTTAPATPVRTPPPAPVIAKTEKTEKPVVKAELPRDTVKDTVQIALLLDTSGSMDGLINQARSHLWAMVDQMGTMTRVVDGKVRSVKIELALFEYGNSGLSPKSGFIRRVLPLTSDLDKVSEKLHALQTNGGDEFVGQAITTAVSGLDWSSDPNALRMVFVAGNEEFDQGPVSAGKAMKAAAGKDISVQLIYCGAKEPTWEAAAKIAKADLMTIDQNVVMQHVPSPQDAEILRLGGELNSTYLAYGAEGAASMERQNSADVASASLNTTVAIERAQLKSKSSYDNSGWDLVDATNANRDFWKTAKDSELPTQMRGKTLEQKQAIVAENAAKRGDLQAKIAKLQAERETFLAKERTKTAGANASSLQTEMLESARKVANAKGYKL